MSKNLAHLRAHAYEAPIDLNRRSRRLVVATFASLSQTLVKGRCWSTDALPVPALALANRCVARSVVPSGSGCSSLEGSPVPFIADRGRHVVN